MPYVQVTWVAGRTPEQKRKLAERITEAHAVDASCRVAAEIKLQLLTQSNILTAIR